MMIVLSFESTTFEGKGSSTTVALYFREPGKETVLFRVCSARAAGSSGRQKTWQETAVDKLLPRLTTVRV